MKLMPIYRHMRESLNELHQNFKTYADAMEYIKSQVKSQGQHFYTTDEYKTLYPKLKQLWDAEHDKIKVKKQSELDVDGLKPGDKIEITWANAWGQMDSITGVLFMKSGIPYVKLPHKMAISVNGKLVYKQSVPFSSKTMKRVV